MAGESAASRDAYAGDGGPDAAAESPLEPAFVFVDPKLGEDLRSALAQGLGHPVRALHPSDLGERPVSPSDLGVVVSADLGLLSGLDAIEHLRRSGCRLPIALASARPTRALVRAAQRAGATTVVALPYDAAELARRLQVRSAKADPARIAGARSG